MLNKRKAILDLESRSLGENDRVILGLGTTFFYCVVYSSPLIFHFAEI